MRSRLRAGSRRFRVRGCSGPGSGRFIGALPESSPVTVNSRLQVLVTGFCVGVVSSQLDAFRP